MAAVCDICGKGPGFGKSVSHSHRRTSRRWDPNVQTVHVARPGGNKQRLNVCTSCIKAGKVVRASSPYMTTWPASTGIDTPVT